MVGKRPFKDLDAAQVDGASLTATPPGESIAIAEPEELVEYLQNIVIYRRDDSFREYAGQSVCFTLTMADGTQKEVMAFNPFVIIDGVGYRTKYEPCQALNAYANRLLR